jgi:hypothetical protein
MKRIYEMNIYESWNLQESGNDKINQEFFI